MTRLLGLFACIAIYGFVVWLGTAGQRSKPSRRNGVANGVTPE